MLFLVFKTKKPIATNGRFSPIESIGGGKPNIVWVPIGPAVEVAWVFTRTVVEAVWDEEVSLTVSRR